MIRSSRPWRTFTIQVSDENVHRLSLKSGNKVLVFRLLAYATKPLLQYPQLSWLLTYRRTCVSIFFERDVLLFLPMGGRVPVINNHDEIPRQVRLYPSFLLPRRQSIHGLSGRVPWIQGETRSKPRR